MVSFGSALTFLDFSLHFATLFECHWWWIYGHLHGITFTWVSKVLFAIASCSPSKAPAINFSPKHTLAHTHTWWTFLNYEFPFRLQQSVLFMGCSWTSMQKEWTKQMMNTYKHRRYISTRFIDKSYVDLLYSLQIVAIESYWIWVGFGVSISISIRSLYPFRLHFLFMLLLLFTVRFDCSISLLSTDVLVTLIHFIALENPLQCERLIFLVNY